MAGEANSGKGAVIPVPTSAGSPKRVRRSEKVDREGSSKLFRILL